MKPPKAFVSHSWDDKERFVLEFAKRLRLRGVDAWIDEWEMMAGDSLVKKIFCEGIQNSDAFIIVLSKNSVQKKWVQEELDVAVVRKIEEGTKIIPVILDDCEVPGPLRSTIWVRINNLENYRTEFERILMSIFGKTIKPPIGSPPNYTNRTMVNFSGMSDIDSVVFNAIFQIGLEQHNEFRISANQVFCSLAQYEIDEKLFIESLLVLAHNYLIKISGSARINSTVDITRSGIRKYINEKVPEYYELEKSIIYELINKGFNSQVSNVDFGTINRIYLHYILQNLSDQNLINYGRTSGNTAIIKKVSPVLKRVTDER